jgi:hypothetical protein
VKDKEANMYLRHKEKIMRGKKITLLIAVIVCIIISGGAIFALKGAAPAGIVISVSEADEAFLKKYKTYDTFIGREEYAHRIAFIPNVPVKDFSWLDIGIGYDSDDTLVYELDKVLYTVKELRPQKPLVVSWAEVGIMSVFGFSYRDTNGQKKYFIGRVGNYGGDPEEYDGPDFIIWEFFPQKMVTGQYRYIGLDEFTLILDLTETSYQLKLNDAVYTGAAVLDFGNVDDNDSYSWNVTLKGIQWAAWDNKRVKSRPSEVFLRLENVDELVFRNHGSAEFRYLIFNELPVGDNWVRLTKLQMQNLVHTVTFNNTAIPMTVYYSRVRDGEYPMHRVDFEYDGKNHSINLEGLEQNTFGDPDYFGLIDVADYNFDNRMDIAFLSGRGAYHSWYQIYIYNPKSKNFDYHAELSELPDIVIDTETRTIRSHGKSGHAGLLFDDKELKWENGRFALIRRDRTDYNGDSDMYIRTTRTLRDGVWKEQVQKLTADELIETGF